MHIEVRLFGALKRLGENGTVTIRSEGARTAAECKALVAEVLRSCQGFRPELLERSAIATDTRVLMPHEQVTESVLLLLPPVCGG